MNMRETIKEKTLRLIGLILITIPLMTCYPILLYLGLSIKIATIATACLSGIAYILLVIRIEPLLRQILPFIRAKTPDKFSADTPKREGAGIRIIKLSNTYLSANQLDIALSNTNIARDLRGNWTHS